MNHSMGGARAREREVPTPSLSHLLPGSQGMTRGDFIHSVDRLQGTEAPQRSGGGGG